MLLPTIGVNTSQVATNILFKNMEKMHSNICRQILNIVWSYELLIC